MFHTPKPRQFNYKTIYSSEEKIKSRRCQSHKFRGQFKRNLISLKTQIKTEEKKYFIICCNCSLLFIFNFSEHNYKKMPNHFIKLLSDTVESDCNGEEANDLHLPQRILENL